MATKNDTKKSGGSKSSLAPRRGGPPARGRDEDEESGFDDTDRGAINAAMTEAMQTGFETAFAEQKEADQEAGASAEPIVVSRKNGNKEMLVGQPFLVVGYSFKTDDKYGKERTWVKAHILLPGNLPAILVDGSTGIAAQLLARQSAGLPQKHAVPNGLRVSRYSNQYTDEGETYYLDYTRSPDEMKRLLEASKGAAAVKTQQAVNSSRAARN